MKVPFPNTFTYTLAKSLYIPLTSRCNSLTLPQTRGPNFVLPNPVIASLLRVRAAELDKAKESSIYKDTFRIDSKDYNGKGTLPPPIFPPFYTSAHRNHDEEISPIAELLLQEIKLFLQNQKDHHSIVFAGEGEPTLELKSILYLSEQIQNDTNYSTDTSIRIITNGLILAHLEHRKEVLKEIKAKGIDELSVSLMTSCPKQYDDLMRPCMQEDRTQIGAHESVCDLIRDAATVGLCVECTGVDHSYVDKGLAEELGEELGASSFRWRPYFP